MLYVQVKQEIIKRCYIHKKFAIILQKIQGDKLIMVVTIGIIIIIMSMVGLD